MWDFTAKELATEPTYGLFVKYGVEILPSDIRGGRNADSGLGAGVIKWSDL